MTPIILLRIAAILAGIQGLAHGALFVSAKPRYGAAEVAVIEAMKANRFFAGGTRSYWDMYFGYGLEAAFVCLVEAALFWLVAATAAENRALVQSVAGLFAIANVVHIVMLVRYFAFPVPMVFDALIALGLVAAAVLA